MDRRDFIKSSILSASAVALTGCGVGSSKNVTGTTWKGWKKGHFQVHFIYTGVGESAFYIFPDGTSMLLDCGEGVGTVPYLPHAGRHPGEWIARYVQRVNPHGNEVDYIMLSHYHQDHAGCQTYYADKEIWEGEEYFISGFTQAARFLKFRKAFDRCYPEMNDPVSLYDDYAGRAVFNMRRFYGRMEKECGMTVEKFIPGRTDQVTMLYNPDKYRTFSVRNLCANGRIAHRDGTIEDLYGEYIERTHPSMVNENGMSLGIEVSYGPFTLFSAGDFSDKVPNADGTFIEIEDRLAETCSRADVAKLNHHGHYSMPSKLVSALQSQVYVSCVWNFDHTVPEVMERLSDRNLYPGDRIVCPTAYPPQRRASDESAPWFDIIEKASYDCCHVVVDVEPSGKYFTVTCLSASDESMTVRSSKRFRSCSGK